jgi:hypothetical protein
MSPLDKRVFDLARRAYLATVPAGPGSDEGDDVAESMTALAYAYLLTCRACSLSYEDAVEGLRLSWDALVKVSPKPKDEEVNT